MSCWAQREGSSCGKFLEVESHPGHGGTGKSRMDIPSVVDSEGVSVRGWCARGLI